MKGKTTCLFLTIFLMAGTAGTTEIPAGPVSGDWYASGNPYNVNGEITILTGTTLNIHEGVEVIFQGHNKFIVNGHLEAIGTETDSILFTAADTIVGWHGIRFLYSSDYSHLTYCVIEYGKAIGSTDTDSCGGGIYCENSNVSISDCQISNNTAYLAGGGLIFYEGSEVTMTRCTVMDNQAEWFAFAGGVLITAGSVATITDCEIAFNTADQGGGLYIIESDATVTSCDIHDNSSSGNGAGGIVAVSWENNTNASFSNCTITSNQGNGGPAGGIWFAEYGAQVIGTMQNCVISDNHCEGVGGGIHNQYCDQLTIDQCTISENTAAQGGGVNCGTGATTELHSCTITGNIATTGLAGGLRCNGSTLTLDDCLVSNNSAVTYGGGIYGYNGANVNVSNTTVSENYAGYYGGGLMSDNGSLNLDHCVVSGNSADYDGGGFEIWDATPTIANCTFYDNEAPGYGAQIDLWSGGLDADNCVVGGNYANESIYFNTSAATLDFCDFYNSGGPDFEGSIPPGLGVITGVNANGDPCDNYMNIFEDPEFVYPTQDDYRLSWGSACIDAGDPLYTDPDATVLDIGAFYYDQSMEIRALLTPFDWPIEIPASGGSFDFAVHLTNIAIVPLTVDAWIDVTLPNGSPYGPVLGPLNLDVGSEVTITRERTQSVPAGAPEGIYSYNVYAVYESDTTSDCFSFAKLGSDGMDGMGGWFNTGESFDDLMTEGSTAVPGTYSLDQNYPNPFNPVTTIRFGLPDDVHVGLVVYDMLGREVMTLVNGWRDEGVHEVTFDASGLASGVYVYRIEAGDFITTQKMVLMK